MLQAVDSLFIADGNPAILIAGDLNDTPGDSSVLRVLGASTDSSMKDTFLVNLMYPKYSKSREGSIKYKESWEVFDHIIVSPAAFAFRSPRFLRVALQG